MSIAEAGRAAPVRGSVVRERLDGPDDPLPVARWLRGRPRPVALSGRWAGGGVMLSSHPLRRAGIGEDPLALLSAFPIDGGEDPGERPAVGAGWFGWLGFELARAVERIPPAPPRPVPLPPFDLAFHDHVVRFDGDGQWWFEALWSEPRAQRLERQLEHWRARLREPPPPARAYKAGPLRVSGAGTIGHARAVAETVARIHAGDLSQANICLRLETAFDGDPLDLWIAATAASQPAYAAYIGAPGQAILSLSPELFLRRRGRRVQTRPIKGTAPRGSDPAALAASPKNRAENVMIVDLMRNDLGRVCEYGTVTVDGLCEVEPAPGVWHLVSTVSGTLRDHVSDGELLRATFPPGSVTGAPKVQALRTIHELEGSAREVYCGAVGLSSPLAGLELNVAIRTIETREGALWLGAGGGVVADSEPAAEVTEALAKAAGVAAAAGLLIEAEASGPVAASRPAVVRLPRPDRAAGVIETLRVEDGRALWLERHLARLRDSGRVLGLAIPDELDETVARAARRLGDGALRLHVGGPGLELAARALPPAGATALTPVVLPGGLGAHKWADRALVDGLSRPGATPLFCDLDGTVLEAGYAAVLLYTGETLVAPPLDGRLLPSVSRELALTAARRAGIRTELRPFTLEQAQRAEAIVLTSSLRGPHPGRLAGARACGAMAAELCARLARGCSEPAAEGARLAHED